MSESTYLTKGIRMPPTVWQRAKAGAVLSGKYLYDWIAEAVNEKAEREKVPAKMITDNDTEE